MLSQHKETTPTSNKEIIANKPDERTEKEKSKAIEEVMTKEATQEEVTPIEEEGEK